MITEALFVTNNRKENFIIPTLSQLGLSVRKPWKKTAQKKAAATVVLSWLANIHTYENLKDYLTFLLK